MFGTTEHIMLNDWEPEIGERIFYTEMGITVECEVMGSDHSDNGFGMELRPLRTFLCHTMIISALLPTFRCWRKNGESQYGWTIDKGQYLPPEVIDNLVNVTGAPLVEES